MVSRIQHSQGNGVILTWASKAASFTVVRGVKTYYLDSTSGAILVTAPAAPVVGDEYILIDAAGKANTNKISFNGNGNNLMGVAGTVPVIGVKFGFLHLIFNGTQWLSKSNVLDNIPVASYAAVQGYPFFSPYLYVQGRSAAKDGGQGTFVYDSTDTTTADDGATVLVSTVTGARYKRVIKHYVDGAWWGMKGDGSTVNTTPLSAAVAYGLANSKDVMVGKGVFIIDAMIPFTAGTDTRGFRFIGAGNGTDGTGTEFRLIGSGILALFQFNNPGHINTGYEWKDFALTTVSAGGASYGLLWNDSAFTAHKVTRVTVRDADGGGGKGPSTAFGILVGTGANGEFTHFEDCAGYNVDTWFYTTAGQAFQTNISNCQGGVNAGGTYFKFAASGAMGCQILNFNGSSSATSGVANSTLIDDAGNTSTIRYQGGRMERITRVYRSSSIGGGGTVSFSSAEIGMDLDPTNGACTITAAVAVGAQKGIISFRNSSFFSANSNCTFPVQQQHGNAGNNRILFETCRFGTFARFPYLTDGSFGPNQKLSFIDCVAIIGSAPAIAFNRDFSSGEFVPGGDPKGTRSGRPENLITNPQVSNTNSFSATVLSPWVLTGTGVGGGTTMSVEDWNASAPAGGNPKSSNWQARQLILLTGQVLSQTLTGVDLSSTTYCKYNTGSGNYALLTWRFILNSMGGSNQTNSKLTFTLEDSTGKILDSADYAGGNAFPSEILLQAPYPIAGAVINPVIKMTASGTGQMQFDMVSQSFSVQAQPVYSPTTATNTADVTAMSEVVQAWHRMILPFKTDSFGSTASRALPDLQSDIYLSSSTNKLTYYANAGWHTVENMAWQDASAVAITGGTVNGASIGATTRSSGLFTTLGATGAITAADTGTWGSSGINGTNINNTPIGGTSRASALFTTVGASGTITGPDAGTWASTGLTASYFVPTGTGTPPGMGLYKQGVGLGIYGNGSQANFVLNANTNPLDTKLIDFSTVSGFTLRFLNDAYSAATNAYVIGRGTTYNVASHNWYTSTVAGTAVLGMQLLPAGLTTAFPLTSTVTTGTAPLTVASTTNVANLNASSLNGATFAAPGTIGSTTPAAAFHTTGNFTGTVTYADASTWTSLGIIGANLGPSGAVNVGTNNTTGNINIGGGTSSVAIFMGNALTSHIDFFAPIKIVGAKSGSSWGLSGLGISNAGTVTYTDTTAATGTLAAEAMFALPVVNLAATNTGVVVTDAYGLYIPNAPGAGTNVTITNGWSLGLGGGMKAGGLVQATQFASTIGTGTAPFSVASTTNVANLNASSLNGATFGAPGSIGSGTPASIVRSNIFSIQGNVSQGSWGLGGVGLIAQANTYTDTTSSGTIADEAFHAFAPNTLAATSTTTVTDLTELYIPAPLAGANVTATNRWSLKTAGGINVNGNASITSAGALTATSGNMGTFFSNNLSSNILAVAGNRTFTATSTTTGGFIVTQAGNAHTDNSTAGTVATVSVNGVNGSTMTATNAMTYTDLTTQYFGVPIAGTNVTATNLWSVITAGGIEINAGGIRVSGVSNFLGGSFTVNGNSAQTISLGDGSGSGTVTIGTGTRTGNVTLGGGSNLVNVGSKLVESNGHVYNSRVVTAAGAITAATTDNLIVVNKTVGAATTVNMFATPPAGTEIEIKDGKGDAAANPITFTPAVGTVDGAATFVIARNYGSATFRYNGTEWGLKAYTTPGSNLYVFTGSGTYNPNTNAKFARAFMLGAGGGAGGGALQVSGTGVSGGGGGGGGDRQIKDLPASVLTGPITVTAGAGGTGGIAATVSTTPGGQGGQGGDTTLSGGGINGTIRAGGGGGGSGGQLNAVSGGGGGGSAFIQGIAASGSTGGSGIGGSGNGGSGTIGSNATTGGAGGSGGAATGAASGNGAVGNSTAQDGSGGGGASGGGVSAALASNNGGTGCQAQGQTGVAGGSSGTPGGATGTNSGLMEAGGSGAGGYGNASGNAGNGGAGGLGAGGGGGGSALNGSVAGTGGVGGNGKVWIEEFF
jgi:hypothetical protein